MLQCIRHSKSQIFLEYRRSILSGLAMSRCRPPSHDWAFIGVASWHFPFHGIGNELTLRTNLRRDAKSPFKELRDFVSPEIDHPHPLVVDLWHDAQLTGWCLVTLGDAKSFYLCTCWLSFSMFPVKIRESHRREASSLHARSMYPGRWLWGDLAGIFSVIPQRLSACLTHAYMIESIARIGRRLIPTAKGMPSSVSTPE